MANVRLVLLTLIAASLVACGGGTPYDELFGDGSANASLRGLQVSSGTLSPAFRPDVTTYTVGPDGVGANVSITTLAAHSRSRVTVQGMTLPPGLSADLALAPGSTVVTIVVTAQNGDTKTYVVTFVRANLLTNLVPSFGSLSPAFDPQTETYTLNAGFFGSSLQLTPTADDPAATIEVDGQAVTSGQASQSVPLAVGPTPIAVVVTSTGGMQQTYTVVVTRAASAMQEGGYLKASNASALDLFGFSIAISGDTLVVGAPEEASSATGGEADNSAIAAGAAYVFVRSGSTWIQQAYLKASNTEGGDFFGVSVSISGDTLVVGAPEENSSATGGEADNSALAAGAAYVFVRSGTTWSQQAYLKASNADVRDLFGFSVSISGDTLVVGAPDEGSSATGGEADNSAVSAGAAYVFVRSGTTWSQQAYLKASNTEAFDLFGHSVSISGDTLVVGADREASSAAGGAADNSAVDAGAAYVFVRSGTTWSQQAYLKASNAEARDLFGFSVSISGDTLVVGAFTEDSSATGGEADNGTTRAGAAYVFVRSGSTWNQQAYLKASNADGGDFFGRSISISGDTLVVGAYQEGSSATGGEADNSAVGAGAAYVFVRSGTTWSQQAYLKASNAEGGDFFGFSVSISGDTLVVGAVVEKSSATGGEADNSTSNAGAAYVSH